MRAAGAFVPVLLALSSCGRDGPAAPPEHEARALAAWVAEIPGELRVVAEAIGVESAVGEPGWTEERLLRERLGLAGGALLRLHVVGDGAPRVAAGRLVDGAGTRFTALGDPPPSLDAQARSLWLVLADGESALPAAGRRTRRSFLLRGEQAAAGEALSWERAEGAAPLELRRREWTGRARQAFLDPGAVAAGTPAADQHAALRDEPAQAVDSGGDG